MNHLKTSQERQDFWYSKRRVPRFVSVCPAEEAIDLDDATTYDVVRSVPYSWIEDPPEGFDMQRLLLKHGFLVISGVLAEDECKEALQLAWDWIVGASCVEQAQQQALDETQTNLLYDSLKSAGDDSILTSAYFPRSAEGGLLPFYGSGHSALAWTIRSNPRVKQTFETLYGTSDLISSFDGIVLWPRILKRLDSGWFHLDQNPLEKPEFEAVQGIVNLLPVSRDFGGNAVLAQSNNLFPEHYLNQQFYKDRLLELNGDDWMEVVRNDHEVFENRAILCCLLQPGDMLLWDARTVHCSYPGTMMVEAGDCNNNSSNKVDGLATSHGLVRAATLVSMMPANRVTPDVLKERHRAIGSGRTLTHWANKASPLGNERQDEIAREADLVCRMKSLSGKKLLLEFADLSEEQRRLVFGTGRQP